MNQSINQSLINNSIKTINPSLDIPTKTLFDISDLLDFKNSIISSINNFLAVFSPEYSIYIVLIISATIALLLKKKYEEDWIWFTIVTAIIFGFLSWVGIH